MKRAQDRSISPGKTTISAASLRPSRPRLALMGAAIAMGSMMLMPALAQQPPKVEVFTSWTSGGEALAVDVIRKAFEARGGSWHVSSVAGFENANAAFQNRLLAGDPPSVRQSVLGMDARELIESDFANSLQDVATEGNWAKAMAQSIYDEISYDGQVYLAPVGVHGESWMFYSKPVFQAVGITKEPGTWDEFFADMDRVKAAGITPIAWGGQAWQETKVFNMVLISQVGLDGFMKIFREGDAAVLGSDAILRTLEIFGRLRNYVDEGAAGRNWNDATNMVIQGTAAVQFMGDWAKGEFTAAGLEPDKDFGCAISPASPGMIFVADGLLMMKTGDPAADAGQKLLAQVVTEPQVQIDFSKAKGSIPIRTDVNTVTLDICTRKALTMMREGKFVPEHAITVSPEVAGALTDFVGEYWADSTADPAQAAKEFARIFQR